MEWIVFRNKDTKNKPSFLITIGIVFVLVAVGLYFLKGGIESDNETFILVVAILLGVLGVFLIGFGIYKYVLLNKLKKLLSDSDAKTCEAKIIDKETKTDSKKAYAFKRISYEYIDEAGVTRRVKSVLSYTPNQVRYLEERTSFRIKCRGKLNIIIEEIPDVDANQNINALK